MTTRGQVLDLIEMVEREPGWRVVHTANGWRIYPADHTHAVIHIRDFRQIDFTKTALRRAGFKPLLSLKEQKVMAINRQEIPATAQVVAMAPPPPPPPRDVIAEMRTAINGAVEALGTLDGLLSELQGERAAFLQAKQLFQTMFK